MSAWTHNICLECWQKRNPGRAATVLLGAETERCCFCTGDAVSGIYIRHDPSKLDCDHGGEE